MKKLSIIALCIFGLMSSVNAKTNSHIEDDSFDTCTRVASISTIYNYYCPYTEVTTKLTITLSCTKTSTLSCIAAEGEARECAEMRTTQEIAKLLAASNAP